MMLQFLTYIDLKFLAVIQETVQSNSIHQLAVTTILSLLAGYKASKISFRKKCKLYWKLFKTKLRKQNSKKGEIKWGILILSIILGIGCIALIIALGGAKVFIWIAVILLIALLAVL